MQRFDILRDGPFRYIHSTETGELVTTLVQDVATGRFLEEDRPNDVPHTLRKWKGILARDWDRNR